MSQTVATEFTVEEFAARARSWLTANMPRLDPQHPPRNGRDDEGAWQRARELQRRLYDGGFAGICFPANTVASAWTSAIRRPSTSKPTATRCR